MYFIVNGYDTLQGIPCDISTIDLQACHLGEEYDGALGHPEYVGKTMAAAFFCTNGVHTVGSVYAWKGASMYLGGYNMLTPLEALSDSDNGYYKFTFDGSLNVSYIGKIVQMTVEY